MLFVRVSESRVKVKVLSMFLTRTEAIRQFFVFVDAILHILRALLKKKTAPMFWKFIYTSKWKWGKLIFCKKKC